MAKRLLIDILNGQKMSVPSELLDSYHGAMTLRKDKRYRSIK